MYVSHYVNVRLSESQLHRITPGCPTSLLHTGRITTAAWEDRTRAAYRSLPFAGPHHEPALTTQAASASREGSPQQVTLS